MMRFRFFLVALVFICKASGQQMQFDSAQKFLTTPSLESYNITQDSKGYIWFATEQGVCRYDGNSIAVFDRKNGLPEGAVYAMAEDGRGRIWMVTSKNRILVFQDGKLAEAIFSKAFSRQTANTEIAFYLTVLPDGRLYINTDWNTFVVDPESGHLERFPFRSVSQRYTLVWIGGNLLPFNAWRQPIEALGKHANPPYSVLVMHQDSTSFTIDVERGSRKYYMRSGTFNTPQGSYFPLSNAKLMRIGKDNSYKIFEFPHRVLSMFSDSDGDLWIGLLKDGIYCYRNGDLNSAPIVSLQDCSVSGITEDSEKNLWCTTLEKGVFVCRNKNIVNYFNVQGLDKPMDLMQHENGLDFFSSKNSNLIIMDSVSIREMKVSVKSSEALSDIAFFEGKWYLGGKEVVGNLDLTNGNFSQLKKVGDGTEAIQHFKKTDNALYGLSYTSILRLDRPSPSSRWLDLPDRLVSISFLSPSRILLGCRGGLYVYQLSSGRYHRIKTLTDAVTKIVETPYGLWLASKGGGLHQFKDGSSLAMNNAFNIQANVLNDMLFAQDNLWIGTNSGLVKVNLKNKTSETYGVKNGLPSEQILKLSLSGNQLFISTPDGLCSFDIRKSLLNHVAPRIYLRSVSINGRSRSALPDQKLSHLENSLQFTFDVPAFKAHQTPLWYSLEGRDRTFVESQGKTLSFENLTPGNYRLVVYAQNSDGLKSEKPVIIGFDIEKPFWERWWFISIIALVATLIIWATLVRITKGIKKREAEKTRVNKLIAESQLTALQAQMNPHFIFNCINSIQNYILKKQERQAYDYLAKFSKLIRMVLHQSQQQLLPLHEELEMLRLYIVLEQLRFGNFDFELKCSDELDLYQEQIPPMMIQPYIENAIWHGLMPLDDRRGVLTLQLSTDHNRIKIVISDNGVGRAKATSFKEPGSHAPMAMNLTARRLDMVNQLYLSGSASVHVIDLFADGTPAGTTVTLYLPLYNTDKND